MRCISCEMISGKKQVNKIYEDKHIFVFLPLKEHMISKGHMVLLPKNHYHDIYDIPKKELHYLMDSLKFISAKLKEKYHADGINILHASGKTAQQSVLYFHLHLVPRYKNDGLDTWPETGYKENNFENVCKELQVIFKS